MLAQAARSTIWRLVSRASLRSDVDLVLMASDANTIVASYLPRPPDKALWRRTHGGGGDVTGIGYAMSLVALLEPLSSNQ